jgi:hypothetical protein
MVADSAGPEAKIIIDHKPYFVPAGSMTGMQIRLLAKPEISQDYDLYLEVEGDDKKIGDTESVVIEAGMQFYSVLRQINPGASDATA